MDEFFDKVILDIKSITLKLRNKMQIATTLTQKGQITIPIGLRKQLGVKPGDKLFFELAEGTIDTLTIKPVRDFRTLRGTFDPGSKVYDKQKARAAYLPDVLEGKI